MQQGRQLPSDTLFRSDKPAPRYRGNLTTNPGLRKTVIVAASVRRPMGLDRAQVDAKNQQESILKCILLQGGRERRGALSAGSKAGLAVDSTL